MLTIALPKGRLGSDTQEVMKKAGIIQEFIPKDSRKLIFELNENISVLMVRAQDVATYVESGAADMGVVGKDVLLEHRNDVMELADLGFGYCKMVVAAKNTIDREQLFAPSFLKVGSKYSNIAKRFFSNISIQSEIIKLYGSVELAAVIDMADCIVDIVSSGATLRENGLKVIEEIFESTARLVCNRSSYYHQLDTIKDMVKKIEHVIAEEE